MARSPASGSSKREDHSQSSPTATKQRPVRVEILRGEAFEIGRIGIYVSAGRPLRHLQKRDDLRKLTGHDR